MEHDLIFERFLNEERISPPDIDIDFCENGAARSSSTSRRSTAERTWPRSSPSGP
jgi:DNA polymerase-3 subunit alpha